MQMRISYSIKRKVKINICKKYRKISVILYLKAHSDCKGLIIEF